MLRVRLPIAVLLIAGFLGILYLDHSTSLKPGSHILLIFVVVLAVREFYAMVERGTSLSPLTSIGVISCVALCIGEWITYVAFLENAHAAFWCINGLLLAVTSFLLIAAHAHPDKHQDAIANISVTIFGIIYVWFLASYLAKIAMLDHQFPGKFESEVGIPCLLITIMTTKFGDVGAFVVGRRFGRHKFVPHISPNKSVEGLVGGIIASILVALILQAALQVPFFDWPEVAVLGIVIGCAAQLGDLAESLLKRFCQVKDSSSLVPGFGGILDIIDSLLLAAPASYLVLMLFAKTA